MTRWPANLVTSLVAAAIAAAAPSAHAQPAPDKARAQALYEEGERYYNLADYEKAIARFKDANQLLPEPLFLYNIAQAYRQMGHCQSAKTFYRNYLRAAPDAPNRAKVEQRIAEMDACLASKPTDTPDPPPQQPVEPPTPAPTAPAPTPESTAPIVETGPATASPAPPRGRGVRIAGLVTGGVGLVLVGAGAYFASSAAGHADDLERQCRDGCSADDPAVRDADEAGESASRSAAITLSVGGAAVAAGAALYAWGWYAGRERPAVALTPAPGGAVIAAAWAF
jgi:tetratricopeptide (TPR) repeat protein